MDGLKRQLIDSVQLKLSLTLALIILAVAVIAGVFSFRLAFYEAHELQDDILRQISTLVDRKHGLADLPTGTELSLDVDEEARVIVQPLAPGQPTSSPLSVAGRLALPSTLADGLQTVEIHGERYRVLVKTLGNGFRMAVAQEEGFRDEIARDSAWRTVAPFLILIPILLVIVANLVKKMFKPIELLSKEVDQRASQELHPVDEAKFPVEVRPFAIAINHLLSRVEESMVLQRRFIADAAHELRSPMAALSLQAERLADAEMSDRARERLEALRQGIDRGRHLLDQLLALARAQSLVEPQSSGASVRQVYRRVLEDLMPLAEAKLIDIGVEGEQDVCVRLSELDLYSVIRNVTENAIRYTPAGGKVDLSVALENDHAQLVVEDSGPGIPSQDWNRIFDPFCRSLGNGQEGVGLGLSIVRTILARTGGSVQLGYVNDRAHKGLRVSVRIPLANESESGKPTEQTPAT